MPTRMRRLVGEKHKVIRVIVAGVKVDVVSDLLPCQFSPDLHAENDASERIVAPVDMNKPATFARAKGTMTFTLPVGSLIAIAMDTEHSILIAAKPWFRLATTRSTHPGSGLNRKNLTHEEIIPMRGTF